MRTRVLWCALGCSACAKLTAHGAESSHASGVPSPHTVRVAGRVVEEASGFPLLGLPVAIGDAVALTDGEGRFDLPAPEGPYDVAVGSSDEGVFSLYVGITRRDPVLVQAEDTRRAPAHHAQISGALSALGAQLGTETVQIYFSSNRAEAHASARDGAKGYGPLDLAWDGPEVIAGQLSALQSDPNVTWATFTHVPVVVRDGTKLQVDLALAPVPTVRRPSERVSGNTAPFRKEVYREFRMPSTSFALSGPGASTPAEYGAPDLSVAGATLCATASVYNPYFRTLDTRCVTDARAPFELTLHASPSLTAPARNTPATPGMRFTWAPNMPGAIYILELRSQLQPSRRNPRIRVYTADTAAAWPDLKALGGSFPMPLNTYQVSVSARGPFVDLNDALGANGVASLAPKDSWRATSGDLDLPVRPPLGPEEARCNYLEHAGSDGTLSCGSAVTGSIEPSQPWVALTAINNKLRNYPEFAAASGIHCVKDCAGADAFFKAYQAYQQTHPGFDSDEPLGPSPPEPPLPPDFPQE